jgi:predicted RNA-binding protein with PIN domain
VPGEAQANDDAAGASDPPVVLPAEVRERVVALAAEALSGLPADAVPPSLRAVARFTPAKRARLAAGGLAAALETDVGFRQAVAETARERQPEVSAAVADGVPLPAAPPEQVAALAYLLRPPGWAGRVAAAAEELAARAGAAEEALAADAVARLSEQLAAVRAAARADADRLEREADTARAEAEAARKDVAVLRRKVREYGDRVATAERRLAAALLESGGQGQGQAAAAEAQPGEAPEETRRLRSRVAELEAQLAASRGAARDGRQAATVRLRVLVDALTRLSTGLQRELAVPPVDERPADALTAGREPASAIAGPAHQGRDADDPGLLDALLAVPLTHLLVDGYNVTKTGYGDLPLEAQRGRLLASLGPLAARTGAEVTVVFDGQDRATPLAAPSPRGVRLLFSRTGETADDVLRQLVRAEPPGRPLLVVTSDRAVVDDVRADGARTVPSSALLRLLGR